MNNKNGIIIFSDLDGTLLDHETYSFAPAQPAIDLLKELDIPLILSSSKTAVEIISLREKLGFSHCPAIVENGAGLLSSGEGQSFNSEIYLKLVSVLDALPKEIRSCFTGFSDWTAEEVSHQTSLSLDDAKLAKLREYSEPGIWSGSDEEYATFCECLSDEGIIVQRGGRFLSLSFGGSKCDQMRKIISAHEKKFSKVSVALGDAPNDIEMLEVADIGIIIKNPSHEGLPELTGESDGKILRSTLVGPSGWAEMIVKVLDMFKLKKECNG